MSQKLALDRKANEIRKSIEKLREDLKAVNAERETMNLVSEAASVWADMTEAQRAAMLQAAGKK